MSKVNTTVNLSPIVVSGLSDLQNNWNNYRDCLSEIETFIWKTKRECDSVTDSDMLDALENIKVLEEMIQPFEM